MSLSYLRHSGATTRDNRPDLSQAGKQDDPSDATSQYHSLPTPDSESSIMSLSSTNHVPTLTPITNESAPSPHSRKRSYDQMQFDDVLASPSHPSSMSKSLPEHKVSARPGPGQIKGYKLLYDPQTKLNKDGMDRKQHKPKYMAFGEKVRTASIYCH